MTDENKITRKQDKAIAALLESPDHDEAALKAGIKSSTLRRWLKRADFQSEYRIARKNVFISAVIKVQAEIGSALSVLRDIMHDKDAKHTDRLNAAKFIIKTGMDFTDIENVIERLDTIEEYLKFKEVL